MCPDPLYTLLLVGKIGLAMIAIFTAISYFTTGHPTFTDLQLQYNLMIQTFENPYYETAMISGIIIGGLVIWYEWREQNKLNDVHSNK